jgi:hypothetical protein
MNLHDMIRKRYSVDRGWLLLSEVEIRGRRADFIAVQTWHSRGSFINGFELKNSRQDVLRELTDPDKALDTSKACDFWWMVVGQKGIVQLEELPAGWGLLEARGERLFTLRAAVQNPKPEQGHHFWIRLLDRADVLACNRGRNEVTPPSIEHLKEEAKKYAEIAVQHERTAVAGERRDLQTFADGLKAAGLDWKELKWTDPKRIAKAVRLLSCQVDSLPAKLAGIAQATEALKAAIDHLYGSDGA